METKRKTYIHTLQDQVAELTAEKERMEEGMRLLRGYLTSSKFHNDDSVNVRDVLLRLDEIR